MSLVAPLQLLRALGGGARAPASPAPEGPSFDELLGRAREGSLETGLPVSIASGAGVELSPGQLERLSGVLDRAHAEGASRIVVMMDGLTLDVDVLARTVLGNADLADGRVLTGVDGIVRLAPTDAESQMLAPPGAGAVNPSLQKILAGEPDGTR